MRILALCLVLSLSGCAVFSMTSAWTATADYSYTARGYDPKQGRIASDLRFLTDELERLRQRVVDLEKAAGRR